jgi:hypothetical protein
VKARFLALFTVLLAALGLAGCFTSDQPLFSDSQAVAPYAKITFAENSSPEDTTTVTRQGKSYVAKLENGTMTMRFMPLGDDLYLAETAGEQDGTVQRLYAVLKLDKAQGLALAYKVMAQDEDVGPGLPKCKRDDMDAICIEDVNAYAALAKAAIAANAKPDTTYKVTLQ